MHASMLPNYVSAAVKPLKVSLIGAIFATLFAGGCGVDKTSEPAIGELSQAATLNPLAASCGYSLSTGTYSTWPGGYQAWVRLTNTSGVTATDFEVLLDLGNTTLVNGYQADFAPVDDGYLAGGPSWLQYQKIKPGQTYEFAFIGSGTYAGVTAWVVSINGTICDQVPPDLALTASSEFFSSDGTLTLTAAATDNVAVRRVVFEQDGVVIGVDRDAPFTLATSVTEALNGRHLYTATAYDPAGNQTTAGPVRVLVAIGNKFFGTAPGGPEDYTHLLSHFDQLTPENAGKWGVVEATRDVMNWADLDIAHDFADDNGLRFKMHTLIWGMQQPGWIAALPPAEQLEEIEEWMALVAERYPDLEMIDVVNEPLHAVPSFSEALGGAGETGWDWVIKSFELAREHFPHSQLILNDYNILILENFTTDYLAVIDVLQTRGLLDGIGLQGHFLERAEIPVVSANLDRLAATGLPIYVSELDVNYADDARQANVMRDLFTVFWNHPSVVGVTHWGHQQGSTFQPYTYLVRTDGSTRPALDWIHCTIAGGTDCTVPEYVPPPRVGDDSGLTLEAEDYDAASGLIALGNGVAYTDDGDWESFLKVELNDNWDTFAVRYAKGNTGPASVTLHYDDLASEPILTVDLPPTADWGTYATIPVPWVPLAGQHDVFIQYHGGFGVANVDSFVFSGPKVNLIANGTFEQNTNGWFSWDGSLSSTDTRSHGGDRSLLSTNRVGNGPVVTSLTALVTPGGTYDVTFWVSIGGAAQADVNLTQKIECDGQANYTWLANPKAVEDGQWVELTGTLVVPNCNLTDLLVYAEGPPGGVDLYVDDVSVLAPAPGNLLDDGDFESSTGAWFTWDGTLSRTDELVHGGDWSLAVTGRVGNGPAARNVTSLVTPGATHQVTFWASITGAASASVNTTSKIRCEGGADQYSWIKSPVTVTESQWSELTAPLVIPDCALAEVMIFAEGPPGGVNLYVDDVVIAP